MFYLSSALLITVNKPCASLNKGREHGDVRLEILDDLIVVKEGRSTVEITLSITNTSSTSSTDYLFYNFKTIEPGFTWQQNCSDGSVFGARTMIFIQDVNKKAVPVSVTDTNYGTPYTSDSLSLSLSEMRNTWFRNKIILRAHESLEVRCEFDISSFKVSKGQYTFYLFYRAGSFVEEFLGANQTSTDTEAAKANLFQGCFNSNVVELVID